MHATHFDFLLLLACYGYSAMFIYVCIITSIDNWLEIVDILPELFFSLEHHALIVGIHHQPYLWYSPWFVFDRCLAVCIQALSICVFIV